MSGQKSHRMSRQAPGRAGWPPDVRLPLVKPALLLVYFVTVVQSGSPMHQALADQFTSPHILMGGEIGETFPLAPSHVSSFSALQSATQSLLNTAKDNPRIKKSSLLTLRQEIVDLQAMYSLSLTSLPMAYSETLLYDASLLKDTRRTAQEINQSIQNVSVDMRAKVAFALSMNGFAGSPPTEVMVSVTTIHLGKPVNGYQVRMTPYRWRNGNRANFRFPFNRLSSPSSQKIPPGRYLLIIIGTSNHVVAARPAIIGLDGSPAADLQVNVP